MSKRPPTPPRPWQPMVPATWIPPTDPELLAVSLAHNGGKPPEMWQNDRYTVSVDRHPDKGHVTVLSIRHNDRRKAVHDWRHLQAIKNDIAGPEVEALELYPAESRLVDSANQFWLWVMPPGQPVPVGFTHRVVADADDPDHARLGSAQRPL